MLNNFKNLVWVKNATEACSLDGPKYVDEFLTNNLFSVGKLEPAVLQ